MMETRVAHARAVLTESLTRRLPTWQVAQAVRDLQLPLDRTTTGQLKRLSQQASWGYGQMNDDFDRVIDASSQLARFSTLFGVSAGADPTDADQLRQLVELTTTDLTSGQTSDPHIALATFATINHGRLPIRNTGLRKRLRMLAHLADKAERIASSWSLRHAQMQAKSRLAYTIDAIACDDLTLAFCAYLAARANRRSIFQFGEQSKAQDTVSDALFDQLKLNPATNWAAVALVKPTAHVIERLTPAERGRLIGVFHAEMGHAAERLAGLWDRLPERMRDEMVMVRGVDSSRWNAYAGALNTMRSAWINATIAADLDDIFDEYLPGKAPRLMAADLAWMYRNAGGELHEDTRMFAALPKPWQVVLGQAQLNRPAILTTAEHCQIDARATGWIGPRVRHEREVPAAEPALVNGVIVADPQLAYILRHHRVFSGKRLRDPEKLADTITRVDKTQVITERGGVAWSVG
jgi:hypothetical protein